MPMDNIQPGQQIGPYRIVSQVGQGGMATVYKAYQAAMDRYVAVKVLPSEFARSAEFMGRFQQEARTIANLEHAHILPIYDYGESDGITYFVMRLLETGTLKERVTAKPLTLDDIDRIFSEVADALGYAHQHGVIHRDIKPSNILIDKNGSTFLTDFGIAKILEEGSPQYTSTGAITGTPAYMSPEQAQGEKLDPRSDIYALGIVLYEMVTGRVPFEAETPLAVILKHLQATLPPPSMLRPNLSPDIERVLLKALAKNRDERYASCKEFLDAWKVAMKSAAAPATAQIPAVTPAKDPTYPVTPVASQSGSSSTMWIIGGLVGLTAICLCLFVTLGAGASIPVIGSLGIFGSGATTAPTPRNVEATAPAQLTTVVEVTRPPSTEGPIVIPTLPPQATDAPQTIGFLTPLVSFGGEGTGPGFFTDPRHVAVDGAGNIYVGDYGENGRVQVFDPNGKFLTQWRTGSDAILVAMAVDRDGTVYVLQGWEIFRYEGATGNLIGRVAQNSDFETLTFTVENELVVVTDETITRYNASFEPEMTTSESLPDMLDESILSVNNVAVDGEGNIYLTDTFLYNIFKFSPEGRLLDRFGSEGENPGQFTTAPEAVAVDGQGRIYASDFNGITVFDKNGAFVTGFAVDGLVFDMAVTIENELVIVDRNAYKVVKYKINP